MEQEVKTMFTEFRTPPEPELAPDWSTQPSQVRAQTRLKSELKPPLNVFSCQH
jgi:hypothetical protein